MCVTFLLVNPEAKPDEYALILANNRDETFTRPAAVAEFWDPNVISGRDMTPGRQGGTWLGMRKNPGKIAVLLNILQPDSQLNLQARGRGNLAVDFLKNSEISVDDYLHLVAKSGQDYNGFALLCLEQKFDESIWGGRG